MYNIKIKYTKYKINYSSVFYIWSTGSASTINKTRKNQGKNGRPTPQFPRVILKIAEEGDHFCQDRAQTGRLALLAQEELGGVLGCSWEVLFRSFEILSQKYFLMIGKNFPADQFFEKSENLGF